MMKASARFPTLAVFIRIKNENVSQGSLYQGITSSLPDVKNFS